MKIESVAINLKRKTVKHLNTSTLQKTSETESSSFLHYLFLNNLEEKLKQIKPNQTICQVEAVNCNMVSSFLCGIM